VHLDIIKVLYLPTDAQENCFKKNIKIYIKTAPTCLGAPWWWWLHQNMYELFNVNFNILLKQFSCVSVGK